MTLSDNFRFDTCSWINLTNAGLLELVLDHLHGEKAVVAAVELEMNSEYKQELDSLCLDGKFELCDVPVDPDELQEFVREQNIGQGEAHSILACRDKGLGFICDDRKARRVAEQTLGPDNVIGTIGLLCSLVAAGKMTISDALTRVAAMIEKGAFLPGTSNDYWAECERGTSRLS